MRGSPGGLARIDALFHSSTYTTGFTNSPMVFGAFPSLHAGCATTDALLLNHFFPRFRIIYTLYVLWLYWSTMYLTHQCVWLANRPRRGYALTVSLVASYLIDLVAGASLAVAIFYLFLNQDPYMRDFASFPSSNGSVRSPMNGGSSIPGKDDMENGNAFHDYGLDSGGKAEEYELKRSSLSSHSNNGSISSNGEGTGDIAATYNASAPTAGARTVSPRLSGARQSISGINAGHHPNGSWSVSGSNNNGQGTGRGDASPADRQGPFLNAGSSSKESEGFSRPRTPKSPMNSR